MKRYQSMPVSPAFTDWHLSGNDTIFGRDAADLLLTVPAEYRQVCEAEVNERTMIYHHSPSGTEVELVGNPNEARRVIIGEIKEQLSRTA